MVWRNRGYSLCPTPHLLAGLEEVEENSALRRSLDLGWLVVGAKEGAFPLELKCLVSQLHLERGCQPISLVDLLHPPALHQFKQYSSMHGTIAHAAVDIAGAKQPCRSVPVNILIAQDFRSHSYLPCNLLKAS